MSASENTTDLSAQRVLVTGAAGFIGFHLCSALAERGATVLGFDNFNSYYAVELKRAREAELARRGVRIVEGDLADREGVFRFEFCF